MKVRTIAMLGASLAMIVACSTTSPSSTLGGTSSSALVPTPTAVDAGVAPCTPDQLRLATGHAEGAMGTSYITIQVTLASGDDCELLGWPSVVISDASNAVLVEDGGDPAHPGQLVQLSSSLDLNLGWSSWCDAAPERPLTARIGLLKDRSEIALRLPDDYGPSGCMGAASSVRIEPAS